MFGKTAGVNVEHKQTTIFLANVSKKPGWSGFEIPAVDE